MAANAYNNHYYNIMYLTTNNVLLKVAHTFNENTLYNMLKYSKGNKKQYCIRMDSPFRLCATAPVESPYQSKQYS